MNHAALRHDLGLAWMFAKQYLAERYRRSALGLVWLVIEQFVMIAVFTLVFSNLMNARLAQYDRPFAYGIYLVTGVLGWNLFANTIARLTEVYQTKAYLVRKLPVRLAVMPLFVPASELMVFVVTWIIFTLFLLAVGDPPGWLWLWLPIIVSGLLALAYGIGLILGILSLFIADIKNLSNVILQFSFWLTPIVYLPDILPPWIRPVLVVNLPYLAISAAQDVVFHQRPPPWVNVALLLIAAALFNAVALWLVHRLEKDIRDLS